MLNRSRLQQVSVAGSVVLCLSACASLEPSQNTAPTAGDSDDLSTSTLAPGVLLDQQRNSVYLMTPGGGIAAIDSHTGTTRWTSEHADQPLFATSEELATRADSRSPGLVVRFLDPETGNPVAQGGEPLTLPLPPGVVAGIDQTLERKFSFEVLESGGIIYLTWEYIQHDVTGVSPPGGRPFARLERGSFRYGSGDGSFESIDSFETGRLERDLPSKLQYVAESRQPPRPPWRGRLVWAITEQRYDPDQLVLERWRLDGTSLGETVLWPGRALAVLPSCNGDHFAVALPGDRAVQAETFTLRYYSVDSGQLLFETPSEYSVRPFCFSAGRLLQISLPELRRIDGVLVERPLEIAAFDAVSGAESWRRKVRDTAFRGPAPPAR